MFTEQSQKCVKNVTPAIDRIGRPVVEGQSDPWFAPANLLIMTPRPSIEIPAQENFIAKVQGTSGKASTTRSCEKDVY